ncbi:hypothetical protein AVT30_gp40 [Mycobacterium phage UnionJack]|uniref:Uncharacterized protein n=1 Tax=Mycobacterium phage UnionJack TaxID=1673876 RepID=A0A0K1LJT2_9CAUD|nr:hypothetical protein AVT30_gp40 [Mycobacterium phage UnionJack]AKU42405.1 hypothetical protein UNIONJACK_53 [Mycobacterium phage UnionJack]
MSTTIREVGTIVVETKIEVVKISSEHLELRAGDKVIASAAVDDWSDKYLVDIKLVSDYTNSFFVPDEGEAVDALQDIGNLYLALKKGEV